MKPCRQWSVYPSEGTVKELANSRCFRGSGIEEGELESSKPCQWGSEWGKRGGSIYTIYISVTKRHGVRNRNSGFRSRHREQRGGILRGELMGDNVRFIFILTCVLMSAWTAFYRRFLFSVPPNATLCSAGLLGLIIIWLVCPVEFLLHPFSSIENGSSRTRVYTCISVEQKKKSYRPFDCELFQNDQNFRRGGEWGLRELMWMVNSGRQNCASFATGRMDGGSVKSTTVKMECCPLFWASGLDFPFERKVGRWWNWDFFSCFYIGI